MLDVIAWIYVAGVAVVFFVEAASWRPAFEFDQPPWLLFFGVSLVWPVFLLVMALLVVLAAADAVAVWARRRG